MASRVLDAKRVLDIGWWKVEVYSGTNFDIKLGTLYVQCEEAFFIGAWAPPGDYDIINLFCTALPDKAPPWAYKVNCPDIHYSLRYHAKVYLPLEGTYSFESWNDDGLRLYVDGQKLIDDWNFHGPTRNVVNVALAKGWHDIIVEYMEGGGNWVCLVGVTLPDGTKVKPLVPKAGIKFMVVP